MGEVGTEMMVEGIEHLEEGVGVGTLYAGSPIIANNAISLLSQ